MFLKCFLGTGGAARVSPIMLPVINYTPEDDGGACLMAPIMNTAGGLCEWMAAIKTARTHKFEYAVASKPVAAKSFPNANS